MFQNPWYSKPPQANDGRPVCLVESNMSRGEQCDDESDPQTGTIHTDPNLKPDVETDPKTVGTQLTQSREHEHEHTKESTHRPPIWTWHKTDEGRLYYCK